MAGKSKEIRVRTPGEASQLLATAQLLDDPLYPFIQTAFNSGMRLPKLRALLWDDIYLESQSIRGDKQIKRKMGGGFVFAPPKSEVSKRTIEFDQKTISTLNHHRQSQDHPHSGWLDLGYLRKCADHQKLEGCFASLSMTFLIYSSLLDLDIFVVH